MIFFNLNFITMVISIIGLIVSILGLIISVITLYLAGTIKESVREVENKILFNNKIGLQITTLKNYNKDFITNIEHADERYIKDYLNKTNTIIKIILPIIPKEYFTHCSEIQKKVMIAYNSYYLKEGKNRQCIFRKKIINKDYIWIIYDGISTLIDFLEDSKINKNILK